MKEWWFMQSLPIIGCQIIYTCRHHNMHHCMPHTGQAVQYQVRQSGASDYTGIPSTHPNAHTVLFLIQCVYWSVTYRSFVLRSVWVGVFLIYGCSHLKHHQNTHIHGHNTCKHVYIYTRTWRVQVYTSYIVMVEREEMWTLTTQPRQINTYMYTHQRTCTCTCVCVTIWYMWMYI